MLKTVLTTVSEAVDFSVKETCNLLRDLSYMLPADVCWVKPIDYARHYSISAKWVHKNRHVFENYNAIIGVGKQTRINIFFALAKRGWVELPKRRIL